MAQITNALTDSLITSQSAPLVRVTDIDNTFPATTTNDRLPIEFTVNDSGGLSVFLSYLELSEPSVWGEAVRVRLGWQSLITAVHTAINDVDAYITGLSAPYTYDEYKEIVRMLRVPAFDFVKGQ